MNPTRILAPLAAAALLAGCLKDTSSDRTEYVLKPLAQTLSTDPYEPLDGVVAYAFDADTARYTVASYEDALNGIASLKDDPSAQLQPSPPRSLTRRRARRAGSACRCRWPSGG